MKATIKLWILCFLGVSAFILSIIAVRHIRSTRIVAQAVAPNGVEFCMVQKYSGGGWFKTSGFFRFPGSRWSRYYYHHEDGYWGNGTTEIDPEAGLINVYRSQELTATFNYTNTAFTLVRRNTATTGTTSVLPAGRDPWDE